MAPTAATPCPLEAPALAAAPWLPVTWSNVTGRCLPWGPGGPLGTLAGGLLVRSAVLGNPVVNGPGGPRRAKAGKDVRSRRSEEVERPGASVGRRRHCSAVQSS